jgi:hypothetical protein
MLSGVISDEIVRTEVGYAGATGLLALGLTVLYRRGSPLQPSYRRGSPTASASAT